MKLVGVNGNISVHCVYPMSSYVCTTKIKQLKNRICIDTINRGTRYKSHEDDYTVTFEEKNLGKYITTRSNWLYYTLQAILRQVDVNESHYFTLGQIRARMKTEIINMFECNTATPVESLRQTIQKLAKTYGVVVFINNLGDYALNMEDLNLTIDLIEQFQSLGEMRIGVILQKLKYDYKTQKKFSDCKYINELRFDFYVVLDEDIYILIEYDGIQHTRPIKRFGGVKAFLDLQKRDQIKNTYCAKNEIPLLRIQHDQIDKVNSLIKKFIATIRK